MKLRIEDIPEEGCSVDLKEDATRMAELVGGLDYTPLSPVSASLNLTREGKEVLVRGEMKARLSLRCGRCLKEFEHIISPAFLIHYTVEGVEGHDRELKPEDTEISFIEGEEIETDDILLEQLALGMPMKPLCSSDCKGLCPGCGVDLNTEECVCEEKDRIDPRFKKLRDIKVKIKK